MSNASSDHKSQRAAKDLGSPAQVIIFTIFIFIVSQVFAAIFLGLVSSLLNSGKQPLSIGESASGQFFYIFIAELLAVFFVYKILKIRGLSLVRIGLGRFPSGWDAVKALLGFGAFFIAIVAINSVLQIIFPELKNQEQDVGFNVLNSSLDRALAFASLVILAPIGEEILVRGYLYSGLRARVGIVHATLITSFLFGIAHLQQDSGAALVWAAAVNTFVLSIILIYLREKTGALYAGIILHAINNFIAFSVHFRA